MYVWLTIASFLSVCKSALVSPTVATLLFILFLLPASNPFLCCLFWQNSSKNSSIHTSPDYSLSILSKNNSNQALLKLFISRSQTISMLLNFILYSVFILLDLVSRVLHSCSISLIYLLPLDSRATQFLGFPLILLIPLSSIHMMALSLHNIKVFQSFIIDPLYAQSFHELKWS